MEPRTIVITGASSGIGLAAAEQLAARGDQVVLIGRDRLRLADAVTRVRAAGQGREPASFQVDFERLAEVRRLAGHLLDAYPKIDVLANNAGMFAPSYRRTEDGHEATIQANHLAHFLLSRLLRDRLRGGRIINTSVRPGPNLRLGPDEVLATPERYQGVLAYQRSKAANILFAREAARQWPEILSVSFHPGLVRTNIGAGTPLRHFFRYAPFLLSAHRSAERLTWLATAPASALRNGGFYDGPKLREPSRRIANQDNATGAWTATEAALAG